MTAFRFLTAAILAPALPMIGPLMIGLLMIGLPAADALAQVGDPMPVGVDAVRIEPLSQVVPVIGRIVARQSGPVTAQVAGPVATVLVEVGDRVDAGDVIAHIEPRWIATARDVSDAAVKQHEAQLVSAQASAALAALALRRMERLRSSAAFNKGRYEDARQAFAGANADILKAQAQLASSQAGLAISSTNLDRTAVRAPYAGVITEKHTEAGDYVTIGAAVVDMINDASIEIEADVPHNRLGGLPAGREIAVAFSDGTRLVATVRAVIPVENPLTRTQAVRFAPTVGPDPPATAINQSVTLRVPAGEARDVATVHKDAILRSARGDSVYVVRDGKATPAPVRLGQAIGNRLEVLDGLTVGALVIIRGNERIRPGTPVQYDGDS